MQRLATRDDLLRRKAAEREALNEPERRALAREHDRLAARENYWELLEEFVARARELGVEPRVCHSPTQGQVIPRLPWIEGYPLTGGAVVSEPTMRYCVAERRGVRKPKETIHDVEEFSLFIAPDAYAASLGVAQLEQQTRPRETWPPIERLEDAAAVLKSLQFQLEASLLALLE